MLANPYYELLAAKEVPPNEADSFLVCGMFTKNYANKALKLEASLNKFGMPYVLYEIPSIHSSISPHGSANSPFNKPKFIMAMLDKYKIPILYLDVDCVIESEPSLINEVAKQGYDFAIFNWLSNERNDAYAPVQIPGYEANRFYAYSHGVYFYTEAQLACSGAVQFWGNTKSALDILNRWEKVIEENPNAADDHSLDFAYNNLDKGAIRSYWLPKSYARYAFWIFDKPVINHPDFPSSVTNFQELNLRKGECRIYRDALQKKPELFYIQPNILFDMKENRMLVSENGVLVSVEGNSLPVYL